MAFYLLAALPVAAFVLVVFLAASARDGDEVFAVCMFGVFGVGLLSIPACGIWASHSSDLAKISSQSHVITVHQERVDNLTKRLEKFSYPSGSVLNADTPIAAIVASLSDAESDLTQAKRVQALAIRSVEARRLGPLSGVIWIVGDYK